MVLDLPRSRSLWACIQLGVSNFLSSKVMNLPLKNSHVEMFCDQPSAFQDAKESDNVGEFFAENRIQKSSC